MARKQREIASFLGKAVSPASRELAPAASPAVPVTLAEAVKPLTREVVEACATMVASMYELDTAAADARVLFAPIEAHVESIQWASATLEVHGVLDRRGRLLRRRLLPHEHESRDKRNLEHGAVDCLAKDDDVQILEALLPIDNVSESLESLNSIVGGWPADAATVTNAIAVDGGWLIGI